MQNEKPNFVRNVRIPIKNIISIDRRGGKYRKKKIMWQEKIKLKENSLSNFANDTTFYLKTKRGNN